MKARASKSMYNLGARVPRPPLSRKRPLSIDIGLTCMFIAQFFKASSLKKIEPITLIVWVLRRVEKMPKRVKKCKKYFFVLQI